MRPQSRNQRMLAALNRSLARHMAQAAQTMRDAMVAALAGEQASPAVERLCRAYRTHVDAGASADQFADTLAQVAVYALFVARYTHDETEPFSRAAIRNLP